MDLYFDIYKVVSYYLSPYVLSINKELHTMYDDNWYEHHLMILYPNLVLWKQTTWKDLYKKSLQMGKIFWSYMTQIYDKNFSTLPISGIDINGMGYNDKLLVLTFNGDLYMIDDNKYKLIDSKVIDISERCYITENKIFIYSNNIFNEVPIQSKLPFIKILYSDFYSHYTYVLTSSTLYIIDSQSQYNTINFENATDINFLCKVSVLQQNGKLFNITPTSLDKTLISERCISIKRHLIICSGSEYTHKYSDLPRQIYITSCDELVDYNNIYLKDGTAYYYNNNSRSTHTIDTNVKRIKRVGGKFFFIK